MAKSILKKVIIGLSLLAVLSGGYYYFFVRCPGIALPFQEVNRFSREKEFLKSFPGRRWIQAGILEHDPDLGSNPTMKQLNIF